MSEPQSPEIWKLLSKLFGHARNRPAETVAYATKSARSSDTDAIPAPQFLSSHEDFEARLESVLSQKGSLTKFVSGRVHLLNVEEIRAKLGANWEKYSDRVHRTIKDVLKNRLSPEDFYTLYRNDTYIIVFGSSSEEEEAKLKCALLAEEIMERVLGEDHAKQIELLGVRTVVAKVDGSIGTESVTSTDALAGLLQKADESRSVSPPAEITADPYWNRDLSTDDISDLLGLAETRLQAHENGQYLQDQPDVAADRLRELIRQLQNFERALAAADARASSAGAQGSRTQSTIEWKRQHVKARNVLQQLTSRAEKQLARRQIQPSREPENEEHTEPPFSANFSYIPMWHVSKQAVGLHLCQLSLEHGGEHITYASALREDLESEIVSLMDRILVRKAKQEIQDSLSAGVVNIVGVPIHFLTLDGLGSQREFQLVCHAVPQEFRNLLVWEIVNAPIDCWRSHLPPAVAAAKPFGRAIFFRADLFRIDFLDVLKNLRYLKSTGLDAVGLDVSAVQTSQCEVIQMLERFAATANRYALKCYVHGLDSVSLVTAAVCAGFDHISGQAIAEPSDALQGIKPTTSETIYLRRFEQTGEYTPSVA
ncbi:MAG: hypothetical protein ACE5GS_07055 [Kiloniellaceae bacterium]